MKNTQFRPKGYSPLLATPFNPKKYEGVPGVMNAYAGKVRMKRSSAKSDQMVTISGRREKLWTLFQADQRWSRFIRARDGKCQRCGATENQTNSHFHGRRCNSVRFHPDNCDDFCVFCHEEWETRKKAEYREWKMAQLGLKRYQALQALAMKPMRQSEAIRQCMQYLADNKLPMDESIPTIELEEINL